ncbi:MAG: peptidoglycan-associated lipoprotein Pal [bacterium]
MKKITLIFPLAVLLLFSCTPKNINNNNVVPDTTTTQITPDTMTVIEVPPNIELKSVYFDYDQHQILPQYQQTMLENAQIMQRYPSIKVRLEGNCDERGTIEYNLALGQKRADACRSYLISYGIASDRITTVSYGEQRPVALGNTESDWRQNRRVDFKVIYP